MAKEYDFVIFGATGFTGKYVCLELLSVLEEKQYSYTWAIAGRNQSKLENVLGYIKGNSATNLNHEIGLIEATIDNHNSLVNMCKKTRVVLDCVGPYKLYGEQVVKACIEGRSDYLDISGEPDYLKKIKQKYNDDAIEKNIFLIGACGFDSIPSDMAAVFARKKFGGTLNSLECYFEWKIGDHGLGMNYGTYASMIHSIADSKLREEYQRMNRKHNGVTVGPVCKVKNLHWNSDLKCYAIPFVGPDMEIVQTSQEFMHNNCNMPPIQYSMYMTFPHFWHLLGLLLFFLTAKTLSLTNCGKKLLLKHPKFFSWKIYSREGPTEEQIKGTSFCLHIKGKGYSDGRGDCGRSNSPDKNISIKIQGPELAYVTTPIALVQSSITLLLERSKLPTCGGALTTASAFSETTIIERMHERGLTFDVIETD